MNNDSEPQQQIVEEIREKQRNTIWPDTVVNGRSMDEFLWKGSPDAPLVQRIGACVIGITFMLFGVLFIEIDRESPPDRKSLALVIVAVFFFGLGIKVFVNGFRRRRKRDAQSTQ